MENLQNQHGHKSLKDRTAHSNVRKVPTDYTHGANLPYQEEREKSDLSGKFA